MKKSFTNSVVTFNFGKQYNGWDIRLIPNDYLDWFYENCLNAEKTLREIVRKENNRRAKEGIYIKVTGGISKADDYDDIDDGLSFKK